MNRDIQGNSAKSATVEGDRQSGADLWRNNTFWDDYSVKGTVFDKFACWDWEAKADNKVVKKVVIKSSVLGYRDICTISIAFDLDVLALLPKNWKVSKENSELNVDVYTAIAKMLLSLVPRISGKGSAPLSHTARGESDSGLKAKASSAMGENPATQLPLWSERGAKDTR